MLGVGGIKRKKNLLKRKKRLFFLLRDLFLRATLTRGGGRAGRRSSGRGVWEPGWESGARGGRRREGGDRRRGRGGSGSSARRKAVLSALVVVHLEQLL